MLGATACTSSIQNAGVGAGLFGGALLGVCTYNRNYYKNIQVSDTLQMRIDSLSLLTRRALDDSAKYLVDEWRTEGSPYIPNRVSYFVKIKYDSLRILIDSVRGREVARRSHVTPIVTGSFVLTLQPVQGGATRFTAQFYDISFCPVNARYDYRSTQPMHDFFSVIRDSLQARETQR